MNTIIIEDEPLVAKDLQKLIGEIDASINIITILDSLKSSIKYLQANPAPDLLFMDIQLSDGVSFDLLNEVSIECPIIFTTAYDEYAIRAFKLNSIDYLLKPIDREELHSAIDKFKRMQSQEPDNFKEHLQLLMQHVGMPRDTKVYKERFTAHEGKSYLVVHASNIACFVKETLIYILTKDRKKLVTDFQTMEEIEELINPEHFFHANRQYIIQVDSVESFKADLYGKLAVKLKSAPQLAIQISREKAQAFKDWIQ